jgi:hypothetical protein
VSEPVWTFWRGEKSLASITIRTPDMSYFILELYRVIKIYKLKIIQFDYFSK